MASAFGGGAARRGGMRLPQLLRALVAAHLDGLAADLHFDGAGIQRAVAGGAGLLGHGFCSSKSPQSGQRQETTRGRPPLSDSLANRAAELGRRAAVGLAERGAEMAVAGEAEVEAE